MTFEDLINDHPAIELLKPEYKNADGSANVEKIHEMMLVVVKEFLEYWRTYPDFKMMELLEDVIGYVDRGEISLAQFLLQAFAFPGVGAVVMSQMEQRIFEAEAVH